jgi:hypothetical protein
MKTKVSRRFLIGSLIGVLAMGPFIINLFRKNRTIELPQRNPFHRHYVKERPKNAVRERFFSEWKSLYESFVFRSEKIEQPDTVEVLQDISEPYNYRFRFLTSFANGQCRQLDKCSVVDISYYEIMHGSISIRGYDNPVLTVSI